MRLPLFNEWRSASAAAIAAENAVCRARLDDCAGRGPPPTKEMTRGAAVLKMRADALFERAMREMEQAVRSCDCQG